jgi:hypothetical protein
MVRNDDEFFDKLVDQDASLVVVVSGVPRSDVCFDTS